MPEPTLEQQQHIGYQRWMEQQQVLSQQSQEPLLQGGEYEAQTHYFIKRETPLTDGMPTQPAAPLTEEAPAATVQESRRDRKKREEREKASAKAADQDAYLGSLVHGIKFAHMRELGAKYGPSWYTETRGAKEKELMKERRKAAGLREKAARLEAEGAGALDEATKRQIRWRAQADRASAAGDYARSLPMGTRERAKAMAKKEAEELKADKYRRLYKVTQIADPAERAREEKTIARHAKYDELKKLFRRDNPLSHEDAAWTNDLTGGVLVNVGRAYYGGTKPMYTFEDRSKPITDQEGSVTGHKQYLFKEAVNCVGLYKPEGALVTEAAARLQEIVCGAYAIPAFAVRDGEGRVLGSFQEKLETGQGGVDLFSWQAHPDHDRPLPEQVKAELLREHTLDWLLCNFDTKGENFLTRTDGHLSSFDKEASFSFLGDEGAQHMSRTYKPHANDTIYNVLFTQFALGNLDLDLNGVLEQVKKVEAMDGDAYLALFREMLDEKYDPKDAEGRRQAEEAILRRKENLREEYGVFFGALIAERRENLIHPPSGIIGPGAAPAIPYSYDRYLNEDGAFQFDETPAQEIQEPTHREPSELTDEDGFVPPPIGRTISAEKDGQAVPPVGSTISAVEDAQAVPPVGSTISAEKDAQARPSDGGSIGRPEERAEDSPISRGLFRPRILEGFVPREADGLKITAEDDSGVLEEDDLELLLREQSIFSQNLSAHSRFAEEDDPEDLGAEHSELTEEDELAYQSMERSELTQEEDDH